MPKLPKIKHAFSAEEALQIARLLSVIWYLVVTAGRAIRGYRAKDFLSTLEDTKHVQDDVADLLETVEQPED